MAVNTRIKYTGDKKLSKRNRAYKIQLDYMVNGKRVRDTVKKDVVFYPTDSKEERKEKERIIDRIKAQLEIELGNTKNGLVSRQLQKANFIDYFKTITNKKDKNTKTSCEISPQNSQYLFFLFISKIITSILILKINSYLVFRKTYTCYHKTLLE